MGKFAAELQAINKGTMGFLDSSPESGEMRTERKKRRHNNSSPSRSRSRSSSRRSDNSDISSSSSSGRSGRSRRRRRSWGPTIRGKRVARSVSRSLSPSRTPSKDLGLRGESPGLVDAINSTVFVGNVSEKTDERDLREFFQKFGTVVETKVVFDPDTHQSRCFGFVKFSSANDADLAVSQAHGKVLEGNTIRCNLARYPPPSSRKGESDRDSPERSKMRVRGRGQRKYRRSGSPGRWGGRSRSRSRSRSHSRPSSPVRKRRQSPSRSYSPVRPRRYGRSRSRSPLRYKQRVSRRSTSRRRSLSQSRRRSSAEASPRGGFKRELAKAKLKEQELVSKVETLEVEGKKAQEDKEHATASLASLSAEFRAVAERSRNRGAMLAKLVRAVKEVDDAKKHLEMAQANLDDVSNSAISLMQEEERNFERAENRGMTSNNDSSRRDEEAADEEPEVGAASPPEIADEQENQASRGGTGEWAAKPIVENGTSPATLETQNTAPGKNWKPLTFKFNL